MRKVWTSSERRKANGFGAEIYLKFVVRKVPQRQYEPQGKKVKSPPQVDVPQGIWQTLSDAKGMVFFGLMYRSRTRKYTLLEIKSDLNPR